MQPMQVLVTTTPKPDGTADLEVKRADGTSHNDALKLLGQAVVVLATMPDPAVRPLLVPATPEQVAAVAKG